MRIGKFKDVIMIRLWLRKTPGRYRSINMFPFAPRALCNTLWDCENALNKSAASAVWKMINVTPNIMFWSDCIKHTMNLALKLHKSRTRRCLTSKRIYPNYGLHLPPLARLGCLPTRCQCPGLERSPEAAHHQSSELRPGWAVSVDTFSWFASGTFWLVIHFLDLIYSIKIQRQPFICI